MFNDPAFLIYLASGMLLLSYLLVGAVIVRYLRNWRQSSIRSRAIMLMVASIYLIAIVTLFDLIGKLFGLVAQN